MTETVQQPDPPGYAITYAGKKLAVTRLVDGEEIGRYPDRAAAVEAAVTDQGGA